MFLMHRFRLWIVGLRPQLADTSTYLDLIRESSTDFRIDPHHVRKICDQLLVVLRNDGQLSKVLLGDEQYIIDVLPRPEGQSLLAVFHASHTALELPGLSNVFNDRLEHTGHFRYITTGDTVEPCRELRQSWFIHSQQPIFVLRYPPAQDILNQFPLY